MTNNHPANHWTNCLPFPGLDSIAKKAIFIPETGDFLEVCNKRWALFFRELGLTVTRSPGAVSHAFNQALLDTLFSDGGASQALRKIELDSDGALLIAELFSINLRQTAEYNFRNAVIWKEKHLEDGKLHRLDGSADIEYRVDGTVSREEYLVGGKHHRLDGPAAIGYRPDSSVEWEEYWVDDKHHRLDGPAEIWYNRDGTVEQEKHYVDDKEVTTADRKAFRLRAIGHALGNCTIQQAPAL